MWKCRARLRGTAVVPLCVCLLAACRIDYDPVVLDAELWSSTNADRSDARPLEGATLSGESYVFSLMEGPDALEFYWQSATTPVLQREVFVPWDLGGGPVGDGPPNPVDFDGFPPGPQRLVALALVGDTAVGSLSAQFTVAEAAPRQLVYRARNQPWAALDGARIDPAIVTIFVVSPPPYPARFALDAPVGIRYTDETLPYFFHPRGLRSNPSGDFWMTSILEPGVHTLEVSWPDAPDEPALSATFEIPP